MNIKQRIWAVIAFVAIALSVTFAPFAVDSANSSNPQGSTSSIPIIFIGVHHTTKWLVFWTDLQPKNFEEGTAWEAAVSRNEGEWAAQIAATSIVFALLAIFPPTRQRRDANLAVGSALQAPKLGPA